MICKIHGRTCSGDHADTVLPIRSIQKMNFLFKIYHKTLGGHTHFRIFCGETRPIGSVSNSGTVFNWGCAGSFAMRQDEGKAFLEVLKRGSGDGGEVQVEAE